MDREKVIKGLERCSKHDGSECPHCPYFNGECTDDLISDALSLLKEQKPVKPDWSNGKAFCGKCGHPFPRNRGEQRRFCLYCGQAVMWGG